MSGCSKNNNAETVESYQDTTDVEDNEKAEVEEEEKEEKESDEASDAKASSKLEGESIFKSIQANYSASASEQEYNKPLYNVPEDYVFEFECSEEVEYVASNAFKVLDTSDYVDNYNWYNKNTYEDGKITVEPASVYHLDANGASHVEDGTWGSFNQLYLVQYIDLETGEELDKPVVTPFTVEHDMKAPTIVQGVDRLNNYKISWEEIPGAVEYAVFENTQDTSYVLVCTTEDTEVTAEDFESAEQWDVYEEALKKEFEDAGYNVDKEGDTLVNVALTYADAERGNRFGVIAIDAQGNASGISNIVDVREIANRLPHKVANGVVEKEIESVKDIPAYVDIEMVDGSIAQMIIEYHGAEVYKTEDESYWLIQAKVANTSLDKFIIKLTGMTYEEAEPDVTYVTEREDELLEKVSTVQEPEIVITVEDDESAIDELTDSSQVESEEEEEAKRDESDDDEEEAKQDESDDEKEYEANSTSAELTEQQQQLMSEVESMVEERLSTLDEDLLAKTMYGDTQLEAWIAYCLVTQMEVIPVPYELFPETADMDYLSETLASVYRQNPMSGVISDMGYNPEYEALMVKYVEEPEVRFNKMVEELNKASEVVDEIIDDSMSDYDKVLALNEYFRTNASYDMSSAETDVDMNNLSEQFIDSHTPYGILCNDYGVCESYAEAFLLTARLAGLEALCETGTMFGGPHEWNRVKVDDNWCILDVTNNDQEKIINALFNVSETQTEGILVPDGSAILDDNLVTATDDTKEYYYVNGKAATDMEEAVEYIEEQLNESDEAMVRIPASTTEDDLKTLVVTLIKEKGIDISDFRSQFGVLYIEK